MALFIETALQIIASVKKLPPRACSPFHPSRYQYPIPHHNPTQEYFKAIILTPREGTTDTAEAAEAAWADFLADDLVKSLSELLVREKAAAVTAGPEAAAWSSFLERLTEGGPLEGLGASDGRQETPAVPAAAALVAREGKEAPYGEPCDLMMSTAGGREKEAGRQRVVSESRMLRGELAFSGKIAEPVRSSAAGVEGGRGRRTLVGGAPAAATVVVGEGGGSLSFAECPEVVETVGEEDFLKIESTWLNVALTMVCVVCAGLAAGLTMGLLSIEPLEMAIKQRSGKWTTVSHGDWVQGASCWSFFVGHRGT